MTELSNNNTIECKSCGFEFNSHFNFCSNCGGKVIRNRLTLRSILIHFIQNVFNVNGVLFVTIKDLALCPEKVFTAFISGARRKYYNPISLLAVAIVLYVLVYNLLPIENFKFDTNFQEKAFVIGYTGAGGSDEELQEKLKDEDLQKEFEKSKQMNQEFQDTTYKFWEDNTGLVTYLNIPVYALLAFLVFWKRKRFNYAETITIVLYQNAFTTLLSFIIIPIFYLCGLGLYAFIFIGSLVIYLYSNYSFQRLYQLNIKQLIFANLRFFIITIGLIILFTLLMIIIMIPIILLGKLF